MSQKNQSDGGLKGFAVGRGLLAAAETLNFSMSEQRSGPQGRPMGNMASGMGLGGSGVDGQDRNSQMARRGGGGAGHLGSTMKLFASLGLSPADLDALAQIPEEDISVDTLPHILMQLKGRKGDGGDRHVAGRDLPSMSPETSYRGGREDWDDMHGGRMSGPSMGQSSARGQSQTDYGYSSMQAGNSSRSYDLGYGGNNGGGGGGNRDGQYSDLSRRDSYGGLGMGSSQNDDVFMQRRMGSPSQGKVQDFLGATPNMFPHVCALCDFDVHSNMEWNRHTNGLRHAENRKLLLQMYPDWDPGMAQNRGGGGRHMDTPNLSAGLLGPIPSSQSQSAGGMPSSWGGGPSSGYSNTMQHSGHSTIMGRVVVAKYNRIPTEKDLISLTNPFGTLRELLVLNSKAFLEMDSHQEAVDMVNYYKKHPAKLNGRQITLYLSKELLVIEKRNHVVPAISQSFRDDKAQGNQVVYFSNLPREEDKKMELLTIAGRFGTVEKHLFLKTEAFVQLGTQDDAEMMVKYYSLNPLDIHGRPIRLNICTKYKTLNVNQKKGNSYRGDNRSRRSDGDNSTSSKSSSSKTTSSKSREERRKSESKQQNVEKKNKEKEEEEEEEEEEAVQVLEGDKEAEEEEERSSAPEEEEESKQLPKDVQKPSGEELPDPDSAPDGKDVTEEEEKEEKEAEAQDGEPEGDSGSVEDLESREDAPAETSDMTKRDLPEDSEGTMDQDFPENMEDFVTLDELVEDDEDHTEQSDSLDHSRKGGMRVVNLVGFRRGYGFLGELLALAKPFGDVVKHLVLDLRPEAYLQFASEEEAKAMARFYNANVTATVCGLPVRISHSQTYPTIQSGPRKVVYVGQLPNTKYTDQDVLKLAESFGSVRKYFLNRIRRECFIEMENAEDAEKMANFYKKNPPKMQNKPLCVYVSRKYKHLKYGHRQPGVKKPAKRQSPNTTTSAKTSKNTEEPPSKKPKEEKAPEEGKKEKVVEEEEEEEKEKKNEQVVVKEEVEEKKDEKMEVTSTEVSAEPTQPQASVEPSTLSSEEAKESPDHQKTEDVMREEVDREAEDPAAPAGKASQAESSLAEPPAPTEPKVPTEPKAPSASLPLAPYDPENPVGVEYVKMGYYCRVCFLFYSNEDKAKKVHCSSQAHYDKLKKHLEKEQTKASSTKKRKHE